MSTCPVCTKKAYPMESIQIEGQTFHKSCFKCSVCKKTLNGSNFAKNHGVYYCKVHFQQMFKRKGNYDEGFGHEKASKNWEEHKNETAPAASAPKEEPKPVEKKPEPVPVKKEEPKPVEKKPEPTPVKKEEPKPVEKKPEPAPVKKEEPKPVEKKPEPAPVKKEEPKPVEKKEEIDEETKKLLESYIKRIEALTERLEKSEAKLAAAQAAGNQATQPAASAPAEEGETPKAQKEFDDLIEQYLVPQVEAGKKFDSVLGEELELALTIARDISGIIGIAAQSVKPSQEEFQKMIQPISEKMGKITEFKDKNGRHPMFNYIAGVAESVPCFAWICIEKTPGPYVLEILPGAEFYTNRVLTATKGKEQDKYDWAINYIKFFKEMVPYIKSYHTTGLTWNPKGKKATEVKVAAPVEKPKAAPKEDNGNAKAGLFSELNKGVGVTGGLKHVTADMKNKNIKPEDRKPLEPKKVAPKATAPKTQQAVQKPPKFEKIGTKYDCSWQVDNHSIVIDAKVNESIYIFKCTNTTIKINGKINCISIDACKKLRLVCDTAVSYIETVNSSSVDIRINEFTPTINVDKCDGVDLHYSKQCCEGTSLNTSKANTVNINIPPETEDGDEYEIAVPEQITTVVQDKKLFPKIYFHDTANYVIPK